MKDLQDQVMELRTAKISLLEKLSQSSGQTAVTTVSLSEKTGADVPMKLRNLQDLVQELETKLKLAQIDLDSKEKQISLQTSSFASLESSLSKERQLKQQISHQLFDMELKYDQLKEQKDHLTQKLNEETKRHSTLAQGAGSGGQKGTNFADRQNAMNEATLGHINMTTNPEMMRAEISFLKAELEHIKQEKSDMSVHSGIQMAVSQDVVTGQISADNSENLFLKERLDGLIVENEALKARNDTLSKQLVDVLSSSKFASQGSGAEGQDNQRLRIENMALQEHVEELNKQLTLLMVTPTPLEGTSSAVLTPPPKLLRNHSDSALLGLDVMRMENEMLQQEVAKFQDMLRGLSHTRGPQEQRYSPMAFKMMEDHVGQLNSEIESLRREVSMSQTNSRHVSRTDTEELNTLKDRVAQLTAREEHLEAQVKHNRTEFSKKERELMDQLGRLKEELHHIKENQSHPMKLVTSQPGSFITSGMGSPKGQLQQSKVMMGSVEVARSEDVQLRREKILLEQKVVELEAQLRSRDEQIASMSSLVSALHAELDAVRGGDETSRSQLTHGRYGSTLESKKEVELLRERINLLEEREKEYLQDEKDKDRIIQLLRDQLNVAEQNAQQNQDNSMNLE